MGARDARWSAESTRVQRLARKLTESDQRKAQPRPVRKVVLSVDKRERGIGKYPLTFSSKAIG
jgi:hypothetical protein